MGEWIRDIGTIHFGKTELKVELNEPEMKNGEKIVHIQNDKVRLALSQTEFLEMATLALQARAQLMSYKNI